MSRSHRADITKETTTMGKKIAIIGLTAGLVGGGAAGLAFTGTSGVAGAQTETTTTVVSSDAGSSADDTSSQAPADRPDPSAKLSETLAPLVTDGTLTQEQADKVIETLAAAGPMGGDHGGGPGHGGRGGPGFDAAAEALGITEDELQQSLRDGSTIAEVATEQGVELSKVTDAMLAAEQEHLAQDVTDGKLTQEQADERLSGAADRITAIVNGERPERPADAPQDAPADDAEG